MKVLTLRRYLPEQMLYTPGVLIYDNRPFALTEELPYKNNDPDTSCIDTGEYIINPYSSEKYPNAWQVMNVKGRDFILLHWGNFLKDTKGCILIGGALVDIDGDGIEDIGESKTEPNKGFNEFMRILAGETQAKLVIEKAASWAI